MSTEREPVEKEKVEMQSEWNPLKETLQEERTDEVRPQGTMEDRQTQC